MKKLPLTPSQEPSLFAAEEIAPQKAPQGQSCKTCRHCKVWEYSRNIFYCGISTDNRTQNGMAKTKARAWCKDWTPKTLAGQ